MTSAAEGLSALPELGELPPASLDRLARLCEEEAFAAGDTVFTMGQNDGSLVYVLIEGRVRMTRADSERGDVSVEELAGPHALGLSSFALDDASMNGAALHALTEARFLTIESGDLRALLQDDGAACFAFLRILAGAGRRKPSADPKARIYRHLLSLVRRGEGGLGIPEMPRHAALAEIAGVTEVEAATAVADLISRGIAKRSYPGLAIADGDALHRAAFD
jgi:CRP-like cAMP-binding protein